MISRRNGSIDVIIPVYNGERYVLHAIASVFNQTYLPNKIIIVDDGSTDKTEELVKGLIITKAPIEFIKKKNGGPNSARNIGLKCSTSEFVAFLDADDVWLPTKLEEQLNVFSTSVFDNLGVVYCGTNYIDKDGTILNGSFFGLDPDIRGNVFEKLFDANKVSGSASAVLIRRSCFDKTGLFDEVLRVGEDWDMWLRLAEFYSYDYADKELVSIRRHPDNSQNNSNYVFSNNVLFYNKWSARLSQSASVSLHKWGLLIANEIISRLPKTDLLSEARSKLSREAKGRMFNKTFGSLKIFLLVMMVINYFKTTVYYLKNFIMMTINYVKYSIRFVQKFILVVLKG